VLKITNNFTIRYSVFDELESEHVKRKNPKEITICRDIIVRKWDTTVPLLFLWFFPAFGTGIFVFLPEILLMKDFSFNEIYALSAYLMILPMMSMFICSFFIDTFGRKQVISMSALIAGLSLFTFTLVSNESHKILLFYVILGVFIIFMKILKVVTTVYTPELYSTNMRTTALGFMNGADRAASILQPIIFTSLVYTSFKIAMAGFGTTYLIGFLVSLSLTKETANRPLHESLLSDVSENDIGSSAVKTNMYPD
jgi:putative MFS transporter